MPVTRYDDILKGLPKERQEAIKAETQMLIDREAFENWYKRFNNCNDKLSAGFAWQAALEYCRKNPEKVLEPTHWNEDDFDVFPFDIKESTLANAFRMANNDSENPIQPIMQWVRLPDIFIAKDCDKEFSTREEAEQWLKENEKC